MTELRKASIRDGVPRIVGAQRWVQAWSEAWRAMLDLTMDFDDRADLTSGIDVLEESTLDALAICGKVDWYDSSLPVDAKRRILKSAYRVRKTAGTAQAMREQIRSIYPDSEMEEWFQYGGEPGTYRVAVNMTDAPVIAKTVEEMERELQSVKRGSAHMENISYMVRHGLAVSARWVAVLYTVPRCGTLVCGSYPRRATLGWSGAGGLTLGGGAEAFADDPARCGTFPQVATLGYSAAAAQVQGGSADVFAVEPVRSGDGSVCGNVPRAATVGYSTGAAQRGQAAVAVYAATPRRCGTFRCGQQ